MSKAWSFDLEDASASHKSGTVKGQDNGYVTFHVGHGEKITIDREASEMLGLLLWKHSQRTKDNG